MINILIREFTPKQTVADRNAVEQFQTQWSTYQKLVDVENWESRMGLLWKWVPIDFEF